MIIKPRTIPRTLLQYQALEHRIPADHPKMPLIQENIRKGLAGYKGECALDYPLSFLPEKKYSILHDVRLQVDGHFFQIDSILLSEMFILLIDAKYMAGKLYFDVRFNQLIQTVDGEEKAYSDPLLQKRYHEEQFNKWLIKNKLPAAPILSLVVVSNSYTIIQTASENRDLHQNVIHHEYLPFKIKEFEEKLTKPFLTEKERRKLGQQLIKQHTTPDYPILEKLQISQSELLKGVYCPNCGRLPMKRDYGKWTCPYCQHINKDAHVLSLKDYELLIGPTITNREMQDFLRCPSESICKKLLRNMELQSMGENKGRVYVLPQNEIVFL
ncbi:nuclease-related domain-containing protein [Bacillus benzoevorans]|uniref:Ribosomal protein L37AE/L43A n=1 Tax=Bacillus benzoevorans TaxID=1456 RepID=A0A7X0LVJ9_9BACI|nr:nuclease-related domain-containing protein [Bacillus benzoevorans]MBB6446081.1 ribosomal protein L37AE/L43A [Bacillus benzoevorans]